MRKLIEPPPSLKCERCSGELRLKLIHAADPVQNADVEIFACAECDHEQLYRVNRDHYSPRRDHGGSDVR